MTALQADDAHKVQAYTRKRDIVFEGLKDRFKVVRPTGAFYIFPQAPGGDGEEFCRRAVEENVLIIPGNVFSERNTHIRISFAAPDDTLKRGVDALNGLADKMQ